MMKPAGGKQDGPQMPLCDMPGCSAWGSFGNGRGHRCRQHVWDGFLPGSTLTAGDNVPAVLAATSVALETQPAPKAGQGSLL